MKTTITELEHAQKAVEEEIISLQTQRAIPNALKMTDAEYKQNWINWQKAVEIKSIIESAIFDVQKVLSKKE